VDFTIQEEPGAFITTPSSMVSWAKDGVFTCEQCKKPIGERQRMFLLMKPSAPKGWRHVYIDDCEEVKP
jgi:hypothetical protein